MKAFVKNNTIKIDNLTVPLREAIIPEKLMRECVRRFHDDLSIISEREVYEYLDRNMLRVDATILMALHEFFGFGHDRLLKFYHCVDEVTKDYEKRYGCGYSDDSARDEMDNRDSITVMLCKDLKEEVGIDLIQLMEEDNNNVS